VSIDHKEIAESLQGLMAYSLGDIVTGFVRSGRTTERAETIEGLRGRAESIRLGRAPDLVFGECPKLAVANELIRIANQLECKE
jgi:hypothetical protein